MHELLNNEFTNSADGRMADQDEGQATATTLALTGGFLLMEDELRLGISHNVK